MIFPIKKLLKNVNNFQSKWLLLLYVWLSWKYLYFSIVTCYRRFTSYLSPLKILYILNIFKKWLYICQPKFNDKKKKKTITVSTSGWLISTKTLLKTFPTNLIVLNLIFPTFTSTTLFLRYYSQDIQTGWKLSYWFHRTIIRISSMKIRIIES